MGYASQKHNVLAPKDPTILTVGVVRANILTHK